MRASIRFLCILGVVVFAASRAHASVLTNETFSYSDGPLTTVSGGAWVSYSGSSPNNVTNGVDYVTDTASQDVGLGIGGGAHSNDTLFAGFDVNVTALPRTTPSYFALFKDSSTFNFFARTWATNAGSGNVEFGIANGAGAPVFGSSVATGTWNRLVIELDQTGAGMVSKLYLGPINDTNIGDFSVITATDIPSLTNVNFAAFGLRQASTSAGAGTELIDNLLIGGTFGDVVIPEPSTLLLVGVGMAGMLAFRRRRS